MTTEDEPTYAIVRRAQAEADLLYEENELALKAYRMRSRGKSWWDIAETLGISEGTAHSLIAGRIQAASRLVDESLKRQLLTMEVARLDELQDGLWDQAVGGDVRAVDAVLRIINSRAKILGLETATNNTVTNNTVVVAGNSEEYIAALQRAVGKEPHHGD